MKALILVGYFLLVLSFPSSVSTQFANALRAGEAVSKEEKETRRISWWWDSIYGEKKWSNVNALIDFAKNYSDVMSSVMMQCGPSTAEGKIAGEVDPACINATHALTALGVKSELWLGTTEHLKAAELLISDPQAAVDTMLNISNQFPNGTIVGFNFDLEVGGEVMCTVNNETKKCSYAFADFMSSVRQKLRKQHPTATGEAPYRITACVSCASGGSGWAPIDSNCTALANGADKLLNMNTYHPSSFSEWESLLAPALVSSIPRDKIGIGSACYFGYPACHGQCHPWEMQEKGGKERVCALLKEGFTEMDMFRLAPERGWPEPWWIDVLRIFKNNGPC